VHDGGRTVGEVVDRTLRRALLDGVDLAATSVDTLMGEPLGASARPPVTAVVMAGGRGERLQPLTFKVPKPLLTVGRTTILERLLEGLFAANVDDVWIAVNYMADLIEDRIGDGEGRGLRIRYLKEREPLERAGALSLLPAPTGPVLLVNADQITNLNFARMVDYHLGEDADITVGGFTHEVDIPYGVLRSDGNRLVGWDEKPTARFTCNAGFYVLSPEAVRLVPKGHPYSTTELLDAAMQAGMRVVVFPLLEKWIDLGTPEDLERALMAFATGDEV
jgi:NDP-sugar pyrophosphorylase family protein